MGVVVWLVYHGMALSGRLSGSCLPAAEFDHGDRDVYKRQVVDIGADTTEISVISLGGLVLSDLLHFGGNKIDESIITYVNGCDGYKYFAEIRTRTETSGRVRSETFISGD